MRDETWGREPGTFQGQRTGSLGPGDEPGGAPVLRASQAMLDLVLVTVRRGFPRQH